MINEFLTPEVHAGAKLVLLLFSFFHLLVALILYRFVTAVSQVTITPNVRVVKLISTIHLLVLAVILVAILII